ncbi:MULTISPECIES: NlpC/P60 family protein [unclassified Bacillus (in: firmicutes)]|uniref:C40 family peptidase n=1 Tax=unclassified Bacillus (in: firmicutes) TaxID=185979 RepID=UPI000D03FEF5|nr:MULTISPECIES: NlpC/P60 family protein [unclassified Bacillus (in: firmicutes)]PRS82929.1 peptidase [Bacillus sp. CJCL2]PRS87677.1 peptidase [Bacillus sp. YBWC18]
MIFESKVAVANVWTAPQSPREIDQKVLQGSFKIKEWIDRQTYEEKLALCEENLIQSQVLLGERVIGLEETDGWMKVVIPQQASRKHPQGYPGYIPANQLQQVTEGSAPAASHIVCQKKAVLYRNGQADMEISFLTELAAIEETSDRFRVVTPAGTREINKADVQPVSSISSMTGKDVVDTGKQFIGLSYLWGGMSSFGYDCSGFAYSMYKACGYLLPRDASDQVVQGTPVASSHLEQGDLLFFANDNGKGAVRHVGIYAGDGMMLHSPKTGREIELLSLSGTSYEKEWAGARRYLPSERRNGHGS